MPQTTLKHLLHKEIVHVECVDGQSTVIAIVFSLVLVYALTQPLRTVV